MKPELLPYGDVDIVTYRKYRSSFDGATRRFPVIAPDKVKQIMVDNSKSAQFEHASDGNWLDVSIVHRQKKGYYSWVPTDGFILHMRPSHSLEDDKYAYVGRFSYEPQSQEFLMGRIDTKHADTIRRFGKKRFGEYVRGIYLRDKRLVLIRLFFDPADSRGRFHHSAEFDPELNREKTEQTLEMLVQNNLPSNVGVIVNADNEVVRRFDPLNV